MASLLVFAKELERAGRISKAGKGLLKGTGMPADVIRHAGASRGCGLHTPPC